MTSALSLAARRRCAALLALALAACGVIPARADPAGGAEAAVRAAAARARAEGQAVFALGFASPALADNVQGNGGEARAVVRLPAAAERCRAGEARCWLVLFLPGFDGAPEQAVARLARRLTALERSGAAPPVVLAAVDGRTRLGGGFYVDSPAAGRFQTMILDRLLPALRGGLGLELPPARTIVAGHSMGGFGALWLALARPDEFAGAAAFAPAARTVPLAEGLLAAVERARGGRPVDPAQQVRAPEAERFRERLLWAMCAAFLAAPDRPGGVALPFDPARRPWVLTPAAEAGLARFDLGRPPEGARARAAAAIPRILVTGGGRDRLVLPADVEAIGAALSAARGPARAVKVIVRPEADHASGMADDLEDAVRWIAGGG